MKGSKLFSYLAFILVFNLTACNKDLLVVDDQLIPTYVEDMAELVEYAPELLFNLSSFGARSFTSSQGMDTYNDSILFQAGISGKTTSIHVLDIYNSNLLGTIPFVSTDGKDSHMNNINCGYKMHESDSFPLLYLSQTGNSHLCYVLQISNDASSYNIVQTIRYDGRKHHINDGPYDWFIDIVNNHIYTYGYYKGHSINREIVKFNLPPLNMQEVVLHDTDVLDSFIVNDISIYQGSKVIDGFLYAPVGNGSSSHPGRLLTIDLNKKTVIKDGVLNCGEPESIGRYKDGVIICGGGGSPKYYYLRP